MVFPMNSRIWSSIPSERLAAARQLTKEEIGELQSNLGENCPIEPWPYGNATTVNPFIVTLGVSPGNSPAAGDRAFESAGGHEFPTAGVPHPGVHYHDEAEYWDKCRLFVRIALAGRVDDRDDALSLFGNLNLDTGRSAEAKNVAVSASFAEWILQTIQCKLRPRFIVALGLLTYLKENKHILEVFERSFSGFNINRPDREIPFLAYKNKRLLFREWDFSNADYGDSTLVMWPQHPSRPPFKNNTALWEEACREFSNRHSLPAVKPS